MLLHLSVLVLGFLPRRPRFDPKTDRVGLMKDKITPTRYFSDGCVFPYYRSINANPVDRQWLH
jgi:hypothetical protein